MKHFKTLGLVVLVASALSVLLGTGAASATVLCKNNTEACSAPYGMGQELDAQLEAGTDTTIKSGLLEATCGESTWKGEVTKAGGAGEGVTGSVKALTFGECDCGVEVNKLGSFEIRHIENTRNGLLTSKGMTMTVGCSGITCRFVTSETGTEIGVITASSSLKNATATLDVSAAIVTEKNSSEFCNSVAIWEGKYLVKTPDFLDVAEA